MLRIHYFLIKRKKLFGRPNSTRDFSFRRYTNERKSKIDIPRALATFIPRTFHRVTDNYLPVL